MAGRILVLDDEENYAEMLQDLLQEHDYRVDMATRPERAIDQLEQIPYDLVISDYKMPVMDGSDFLRKARELYPNLPFILVSGLMNTPELVKVANMSVTLVMEKPLDTAAFLAHVAKFAEPMTSEEKLALESASNETSSSARKTLSYPEEPRFFSAGNSNSKRFMQDLWSVSQEGEAHLFILEPTGGDALLALKDLSVWRGNQDKPVQEIDFDDFATGGAGKVKEILSHDEFSDVFLIRLSALDQIEEAQAHLQKVFEAVGSAKEAFFAYVLEGSASKADFVKKSGDSGCILPAFCERPTDVALYAHRFARLHSGRLAKPNAARYTAAATYAILVYEWPENYRQLHDLVIDAVENSEDAPLRLDSLGSLFAGAQVPAPEQRLAGFMKQAQVSRLKNELALSGQSVPVVARRLGLSASVKTEGDFKDLPLLNSKLATL